jgi:hypothetical protein
MVESLLFLSINIVPRAQKNARDKSFLLFVTNLGKRIAILPSPDKIVSGESWAFFAAQSVPHGGTTEQTKDERFETL